MKKILTIFLLGVALVLASCKTETKTTIEVAGVKLDKTAITLQQGASETLIAAVEPSDAEDKTVVWSSSADAIVTVDKTGKVTAVAIGSAVIKATAGVFSATCTVTVSPESTTKGIDFVYIPAGTFTMGAPAAEFNSAEYEYPQHQVTLSGAFRLSKYEITNAQFAAFLNENKVPEGGIWAGAKYYNNVPLIYPVNLDLCTWGLVYTNSKWTPVVGRDNYPVVYVTYCGALEFSIWMGGDLPTEAQWEYACRAGSQTPFSLGVAGDGNQLLGTMASFDGMNPYDVAKDGNYFYEDGVKPTETSPVGSYQPNSWGLYDMHGNVREWCLDWWDEKTNYPSSPQTDPIVNIPGGNIHMTRGGAYFQPSRHCRSAARMGYSALTHISSLGFRVALPVEK